MIRKPREIDSLETMNKLVSKIPEITFLSIDPPYLLLGKKDVTLRGVVLRDAPESWTLISQYNSSPGDYRLLEAVVKGLVSGFDAVSVVPPMLEDALDYEPMSNYDDQFNEIRTENDEDSESDSEDPDDDDTAFENDDDDDEDDIFGSDGGFDDESYDEFDNDDESDEEDDDDGLDDDEYEDSFDDDYLGLENGFFDFDIDELDERVEVPYALKEAQWFRPGWVERLVERDMNMVCNFIRDSGVVFAAQGIFHTYCIGPWLLEKFDIDVEPQDPAADPEPRDLLDDSGEASGDTVGIVRMMDYLAGVQWQYRNSADTTTEMRAVNPDRHPEIRQGTLEMDKDEDIRLFTKSISAVSEEMLLKMEQPVFFSYADLAAFVTDSRTVVIPYNKIHLFVPGRRIDDLQMVIDRKLTEEEVADCFGLTPVFVPRDHFHQHSWPGLGYDETQRTFLLVWNPAESGVTYPKFLKWLQHIHTSDILWPVSSGSGIRMGDRFFIICRGDGMDGIVASGLFGSNPYPDGDGKWSAYLSPNVMIDPQLGKPMSSERLRYEIPEFDWEKVPDGATLPAAAAKALSEVWKNEFQQRQNENDAHTVNLIYRNTF